MPKRTPDPRLDALLGQLERAFDRRSWHGPNLVGSIRRLDARAAAWRPQPDRHNAWEIVVHAAYWKYRLCRLLADDPPAGFSIPGSDWWVRPARDAGDAEGGRADAGPGDAEGGGPETESGDADAAWKADRALLGAWHARLLEAVSAFDPARLDEAATTEWSYVDLIAGGAAHDLYHAGQIQLLNRMRGGRG